jgi:hypothetical protein
MESLDAEFRRNTRRRHGYIAGGDTLAAERAQVRELRRQPVEELPKSPTSEAERNARRRLVRMENVRAKYGAEARITAEMVEEQRALVRKLTALGQPAPSDLKSPPLSDVDPNHNHGVERITWLPSPVLVYGPRGGGMSVVGYDSSMRLPGWLREAAR